MRIILYYFLSLFIGLYANAASQCEKGLEKLLAGNSLSEFKDLNNYVLHKYIKNTEQLPLFLTGDFNSYFHLKSMTTFSKKKRTFFKKLKRLSNPNTAKEREYAALIIEYENGTTKTIRYTSNLKGAVLGEHLDKAMDVSEFGDINGPKIKKLLNIHTHPNDPESYYMMPSEGDYQAYQQMLENLKHYFPNSKFEAYILPTCNECDDIVIGISEQEITKSH